MPTECTIDLDAISAPIDSPADSPADIRRQIRSIRDKQRQNEKAFNEFHWYGAEYEGQEAPDTADWYSLINQSCNVLESDAKDLWICVWMIEAMTAQHGFAGFRDGCKATTLIVENFWEQVEPSPDGEGGVEETVKMIASLNDSFFIDRLTAVPISEPVGDQEPMTCGKLNSADEDSLSEFVAATDVDFFSNLQEDLNEATVAFEELTEQLSEKCGDDAPPSAKIREALSDCKRLLRGFCGHVLPQDSEVQPEGDSAETGASEVATVGAGDNVNVSTQVQSREDAFRALERIADYFRRTEPHSPVSYALEQAVRWGRMPLPELLTELVAEETARSDAFRLAGIRPPDSDDDD